VFPIARKDLSVAMRLVEAGCKVVMPWAAPIGSARGHHQPRCLELLREPPARYHAGGHAGLGAPSHAAAALELGYDAVLTEHAIRKAGDRWDGERVWLGVEAGRTAYEAGLMEAATSPPLQPLSSGHPFWHAYPDRNAYS